MISFTNAGLFHEIIASENYTSRIRIYSIDLVQNPIDVSVQSEVEMYGTLLKYKVTDTDSRGRIAKSGIKINNYFVKDEQLEIGKSVSCNIELTLINDDGFFSSYDWSQTIVVYWDVYDSYNTGWVTCPLGVYWWERPGRTSAVVVKARANDAISMLGERLDFAFMDEDDPEWTTGLTLEDIYHDVVDSISGVVADTSFANVPNASVVYHKPPFDASMMSRREILEQIAGACGGIVQASRNGVVRIKFFSDAGWKIAPMAPTQYYALDGDSYPTPILKLEIGEYTVPVIDKLIARVAQTGEEYTTGSGTNVMYLIDNKFFDIATATFHSMVDTIFSVVNGQHASSDIVAYTPIYLKAIYDPSVEAGDIIRVVRGSVTYAMPIFQQVLTWRGGLWTAEVSSSGFMKRRIPSAEQREQAAASI